MIEEREERGYWDFLSFSCFIHVYEFVVSTRPLIDCVHSVLQQFAYKIDIL